VPKNPPKSPFTKGDFKASISERQSMVATIQEIIRSALIFASVHLVLSLHSHHKTKSSRKYLPTENPEAPSAKGV
jgi:hypothetical protein